MLPLRLPPPLLWHCCHSGHAYQVLQVPCRSIGWLFVAQCIAAALILTQTAGMVSILLPTCPLMHPPTYCVPTSLAASRLPLKESAHPPCSGLLQALRLEPLPWLGRLMWTGLAGMLVELLRLAGIPPCAPYLVVQLMVVWKAILVQVVLLACGVGLNVAQSLFWFAAGVIAAAVLLLKDDVEKRRADVRALGELQVQARLIEQQVPASLPNLRGVVGAVGGSCEAAARRAEQVQQGV